MEGPARAIGQSFPHLGMLVRSVVAGNGADYLAGRDGTLDGIEELYESPMDVFEHVAAEDRAVKNVEGGKQGGGTVGHRAASATLQRQTRLDAIMGWIWLFSSAETITRGPAG